ncbi:hypothetical protein EV421DRAFT_1898047 [Armillaria borealis]|uniref:Uncharacterized protein n=1 Tax=Armillaria borealis TaxID=47425 RepID=A0AA39MZ62_9AGAR|nr:hypothetical protein EV421DRAFT_1898047 [Armillaria borealis]
MTSPEHLPALSSLPPPSDLFTSTAPYILTIFLHDRPEIQRLTVQCSHEPTLKLLKEYLEKWAESHSMKLSPIESKVCPRIIDTLVVKPSTLWDRYDKVNPAIILAFVEGVVGYKMVYTTGSFWMYRRTTLFK